MVAAYKGLCVVLHATGRVRNVKPWEELSSLAADEEATLAMSDVESISKSAQNSVGEKKSASLKRPRSFNTFGTSNTFSDESWVERYAKKPMARKVFETNVWVQDDTVRLIQDKIVRQSQVWAVILTTIITVFFTALPRGNFY